MTSHLEESLQRDIDRLLAKINDSADLVERALRESVAALLEKKLQLAYMVILRDQRIDEMEKQIDRLCLEFLVRQQPVAHHLRLAYVIIKINADLERIGDYAESIARQSLKVAKMEVLPCASEFSQLGELACKMFRNAVEAFTNQDVELARSTMRMDQQVDQLRTRILADLINLLQQGQLNTELLNPLTTIARRLERAADQSKNICEEVLYLATGEFTKHTGTEVLRVLFVDHDNASASQMAEALGNSLGITRLVFASAGVEPGTVDERLVKFMTEKGIDVRQNRAKSIAQVPNFEHYQVIVVFSKEVRAQLPPTRTKTVILDWSVVDPRGAGGEESAVKAAYEQAFVYLREHIKDLAEAIIGNINEQH